MVRPGPRPLASPGPRPGPPLLGLLALVLAACVSRPLSPGPRPPAPPPQVPAGYYDSPGSALPPAEDRLEERGATQERRLLLVPARLPPELAHVKGAREPIRVTLWLPRDGGRGADAQGRRPLVLLSPVLGSPALLSPFFADAFTRRGWIAALVERKDLEFDPDVAIETAEAEVRLLVLRARQALDTLLLRPDVDPARLATFGVSAGGIVSCMLAGAEPRFIGHVFILAGGPLADVLTDTEEDRFLRYGRAMRARHGFTPDQIRERLRAVLKTDPIALAPYVPREQVLLMLARDDASVPTRYGWALHEALGRPAYRLLPGGHRSCWACLPWILQETTGFLAQRFAGG